jgi:hypothetical protein
MEYSNWLPYIFGIAAISLGAFFGVVGNKLVTVNYQTNFKYIFYILGSVSIILGLLFLFVFINKIDLFGIITTLILIGAGILLIRFTNKNLNFKYIYETSELAPIINRWTSNADHSEIKLFGGDLSFFGEPFSQMDNDPQYSFLRNSNFRRVLILCEEPKISETKIRYGKILNELNGTELRFYEPGKADLKIRGRLKTINGVSKLLVYLRLESGKYQTIETDTANSNGALYNNIWNLTWSLAKVPSQMVLEDFIKSYKSR